MRGIWCNKSKAQGFECNFSYSYWKGYYFI